MEISVVFAESSDVSESLTINRKIAEGKFSVYEVQSPKDKTTFALKVFPKTIFGTVKYQKEKYLLNISHPNVIQHIPAAFSHSKFYALLTEYAEYGNFYDIVKSGLLNTEVLVRTYFHHLMNGLEFLHSKNIAHLDLKLENLAMGSDFRLKIIDFDQMQSMKDGHLVSAGTIGYRAPEVRKGSCKDFAAADVYSAGIILYAFLTGEFPFFEGDDPKNKDIQYYSTFIHNNEKFWRVKAKEFCGNEPFSDEFIELINGMLHSDPSQRMKIKDIKKSLWYKGPILQGKSLDFEMRSRCESLFNKKRKTTI